MKIAELVAPSALPAAVFTDFLRKHHLTGVLSSLVVLPVLNAFVLSGLYQTLDGAPFDAARFASSGPYFLATAAFVAGAASWETELLTGSLKSYVGHPWKAIASRGVFIAVCTIPFLVLFSTFRAVTGVGVPIVDVLVLGVLAGASAALGIGVALGHGFRTDKSINNVVQVAPWVYALGPGPFFEAGMPGISWIFPGGGPVDTAWIEVVRAVAYLVVGLFLIMRALGQRRDPIYSP